MSSQFASSGGLRHFATLNVGEHGDAIQYLLGGVDILDRIKRDLEAAPGQELRITARVGMMAGPGDGVPLPPPEGDPQRFVLSGSSATGLLRSPSGQHCARIEITQLECVIVARRNEAVRIPFVRIQLSDVHAVCADFPKPTKWPWPRLSPALAIDGIAVPRGWEHTIVYWIEHGVHHVEIPRSSRAIRGLSFLGDDDELVVALVSGGEFVLGSPEDAPTAMLEAEVLWRTRPDGTRG